MAKHKKKAKQVVVVAPPEVLQAYCAKDPEKGFMYVVSGFKSLEAVQKFSNAISNMKGFSRV